MTFLELQKKIVSTRKARAGKRNATDYYGENFSQEEFETSVYKRTLSYANEIVKRLLNNGNKKIKVCYQEPKKEFIYHKDYKTLYDDAMKDAAKYEKWWKESSAKFSKATDKILALQKESSKATDEILALKEEVRTLKAALKKSNIGGRHKDKAKEDNIVTYKLANPTSSVKDIADALGVSTTTVQRALVANGLNKKRKK